MGSLTGRVAIVTGASRGIGAAIALRFAAEGARVAIVARTANEGGKLAGSLSKTAERIRALGGECIPIIADLADADSRAAIVPATLQAFGRVDILVNNAAWARFGQTHRHPDHICRLAFEVNVHAPLALMRDVIPAMLKQGQGWVLNLSSGTSLHPSSAPYAKDDRYLQFHLNVGPTLYGASKAALERLSTGMAAELSDKNIAVNTLAPVEAVASEGATRLMRMDDGMFVEPVEAMAEAALALCSASPVQLSGRNAISLRLLEELRREIRSLDGSEMLELRTD
jgi:citronellol/citronellal dehydrogenase